MIFANIFLCCCISFTIVDSVDIGNFANGVAFGNGYVWACDNGSDNIYKIDPASMAIVSSFSYAGGLDGLCHDGEYLWIGYYPNLIHKIDELGGFIGSWSSPGGTYSYGMAFDGTYLWHADKNVRTIYKLDYLDPTAIVETFPVTWEPRDLGWYGGHLWASADYANIYELNPLDMTVINTYPATRSYCSGIALGGGYLWFGTNNSTGWVYKVDGVVGMEEVRPQNDDIKSGVISIYPNPFTKLTKVSFSIGQGAEGIELRIFDAAGRMVKDLSGSISYAPCAVQVSWDGRNDAGQRVSSGVYFVCVNSHTIHQVAKVVLTD